MKYAVLFVAIAVLNVGLMFLVAEPGSAIVNSDPVVVAFAIYGLCHIEMWMVILAFRMNWWAAAILADLSKSPQN